MLGPLETTPSPWTGGVTIAPWFPYSAMGAATVLVPLALTWRMSVGRRRRTGRWLATIPIGGLLLVAYTLADAYLLQLDFYRDCPPYTFVACREPDPLFLMGMVGSAGLAAVLAILLALESLHPPRLDARTGLSKPFALLIGAAYLGTFIAILGATHDVRLAPLADGSLVFVTTTGFPVLFIATVRPDLLGGPWGTAARGVCYFAGAISMSVAFTLMYFAFQPLPVY